MAAQRQAEQQRLAVQRQAETTQRQAEEQKKLDVIANNIFISAFSRSGEVCAVISEEEDEILDDQEKDKRGSGKSAEFSVEFDLPKMDEKTFNALSEEDQYLRMCQQRVNYCSLFHLHDRIEAL